jgi:hypothetical protein
MSNSEKTQTPKKRHKNLMVFDPEKPIYQKLHVCMYLAELEEEAQKESDITCFRPDNEYVPERS